MIGPQDLSRSSDEKENGRTVDQNRCRRTSDMIDHQRDLIGDTRSTRRAHDRYPTKRVHRAIGRSGRNRIWLCFRHVWLGSSRLGLASDLAGPYHHWATGTRLCALLFDPANTEASATGMTDEPKVMKFCSDCGSLVSRKVPLGDVFARFVCEACETIHYQNPKIVVGCLPEWEDQLLLCRRAIDPRSGFWTFPAGFMEQ